MTLLSPNHNFAADECIAQIPQHHIPTPEEKVRASESFDKSVLVAAHMAALHDAYIMEMATHPVNEVIIKPSSPTSSIGGLKPSTLKQLKVGKVHRRRVLSGTLCAKTLCTKSHNGLMVVNVFEDEEGNATPIYLSNAMEGNGGSAQAQQLYPQDSKVAVKEPYLTRLPDGEIMLLVEKTTDLVFLWVPEYVKEKGVANGGQSEDYENGRDAFAIEKAEYASVNGGDFNENEGKDGDVEVVDNEKGNVHPCENGVMEESAKGSKASRELKFEDVVNAKEEKGSVENAYERGVNRNDVEENASVESVIDGDNTGKIQEAVGEEDVKGLSASQEMNLENTVDVKEKGDDEAVVATKDVTRELSLEAMLAVRKGEQDGADAVKEHEGERKENAAEMNGVETRDIEKGDIGEETLNGELDRGKLGTPGDADARELSLEDMLAMRKGKQDGDDAEKEHEGEKKENAAEMNGVDTRDVEKGDIGEETLNGELNQGKLGTPGEADAGETASSLRVKGNAIFARGDFNKAASVYLRAVEKARSDELKTEEVLCLSNRAEVWLRLCRNQAAFDDAEAALKLLRDCDGVIAGDLALAKALFRKGRALMGLHKYEEALCVLQEVLAKAPADRQLREAAIKCRNHLQRVLKPGKRQRAAANRKKSLSLTKQ